MFDKQPPLAGSGWVDLCHLCVGHPGAWRPFFVGLCEVAHGCCVEAERKGGWRQTIAVAIVTTIICRGGFREEWTLEFHVPHSR